MCAVARFGCKTGYTQPQVQVHVPGAHRYNRRKANACLGVTKLSVGRTATTASSMAWNAGWANT